MGRYDSPVSIVSLFLVATVVSVGLIYLMDAEAESRLLKQGGGKQFSPAPRSSVRPADNKGDLSSFSTTKEYRGLEEGRSGPGSGHNSILAYFGYKLKDLFKRHHSVSKRSVGEERSERKVRNARQDGHYYEDSYSSGRNIGSHIPVSPAAALITPPAFTSSLSSDFHKIRHHHAIKKLDGGGLDLQMVERMILDSNPGRFRPSPEHQETERKSNYHVVPYTAVSGVNAAGAHANNNHKLGLLHHHPPPSPQQQLNPNSDIYGVPSSGAIHTTTGQRRDSSQPRTKSAGRGEKLDDSSSRMSQEKISPSSSSSSASRRGGESSSGIELLSNRKWNGGEGNNHNLNSNDNESENSIQRVTKLWPTTAPAPSTPSRGKAGRMGTPGHTHHHGKGRNNGGRQRKKSSSSFPPTTPPTTVSPRTIEDGEPSDFREAEQQEEQEGVNEKRRKTNHMNSRSGSSPAVDVVGSSPHQYQAIIDTFEDDAISATHRHHSPAVPTDSHNNNNRLYFDDDEGRTGDSTAGVRQEEEGNGAEMTTTRTTLLADTKRSILKEDVPICYKTDDVLIVVAITCCLNFAFVLVVWGCVRWFSISSTSKERDFHQLDCEDGAESVIFHEDHDHEDCCWRPGSPINFDGKCGDHVEDCVDVTHGVHCSSRRRNSAGHSTNKLGGNHDGPDALSVAGLGGLGVINTKSLFPTCSPLLSACSGDTAVTGSGSLRLSSLRRKPSDRFHFYRQKQYQKNLREFGLGFGPSLLSSACEIKKPEPTGIPKASASMYCFRKSDVPQQLALKSRHKFYSHSMEDLHYFHT